MKQLVQKLRDGVIRVLDVPPPAVGRGMVLVQNHFSLISSGTEGSTVATARKSLIGKAKERPAQVRQVLDVLTTQGPVQTYHAVMKKLDGYSPLGYSSAGVVLEVGEGVTGFAQGDKVACAGVGYANHAEIVAVPVNLCVKLAPEADLALAAANTLGAIALQGVRQAELRLGESALVIGLGLLGQLTCRLLRAAGVRVLGVDIDPAMVALAAPYADAACLVSDPGLEVWARTLSNGVGLDAALITAAAHDNGPVNLAGRVLRLKGKVVVVGNVPTDFERDLYYKKELDLRLSMSYGPGRYDPSYEEKGHDYPPGYVRWTENRNMQAFQELIASGKLPLDGLYTHRFPLAEAARAYDVILKRQEPVLGVLLSYDAPEAAPLRRRVERAPLAHGAGPVVGFIGAGNYAQGSLLPNLPRGLRLSGVVTSSGTSSRRVADKYGFAFCSSDAADVLGDAATDTVFIATRHDSHARYVQAALAADKAVFVEKPLCTSRAELAAIARVLHEREAAGGAPVLMVGFNRRFAPLVERLRQSLRPGPMSLLYRVNAGAMPGENWFQDPAQGGRVEGEIGHFIDLMTYLNGSLPVAVKSLGLRVPGSPPDTVGAVIAFENGSVGTLAYYANGAKGLPKEYLEVHKGGASAVLTDFKSLVVYENGHTHKTTRLVQDKGQAAMLERFLRARREGWPSPIPFEEIAAVHAAAFTLVEDVARRDAASEVTYAD